MRRGIIFTLFLLLVCIIAVWVFMAYSNHVAELSYDDMESKSKSVNRNGYFSGMYKCELKGKYICDYKCTIEGESAYFTLYVTPNKEKAYETDKDGYARIAFKVGEDIKNITYVADGAEIAISFGKQNRGA